MVLEARGGQQEFIRADDSDGGHDEDLIITAGDRCDIILASLAADEVLLVGSGFSFHNLHAFFRGASPDLERSNTGFEEWLLETCSGRELSEEERESLALLEQLTR